MGRAYRYKHGWIPLVHVNAGTVASDYRAKVQLSRSENRALGRWTGTSASLINGYMRGGKGTEGGREDAEAMAGLAERYQLPGSAVGFRALGPGVIPDGDQSGKTITAKGFSSVALDREAGGEFGDRNEYPVVLSLLLPQGTRGIAVEGTDHAFPDQREFILPDNSRFAIESDSFVDGHRRIEATVLPPEAAMPEPEPVVKQAPLTGGYADDGYDDYESMRENR